MTIQNFGWKPKGERLLKKPRHSSEDNISMDSVQRCEQD